MLSLLRAMLRVLAHFTLEALNGEHHLVSLCASLGGGEQMVDEHKSKASGMARSGGDRLDGSSLKRSPVPT